MFKTPWEMEHLARERMERLAPRGPWVHPVVTGAAPARRVGTLIQVRRRCGRGLIAVGERLAGAEPRTRQPLSAGSVRLG